MAKDGNTLSEAVQLLTEIDDALKRPKVSRRSQSSVRVLSVKVRLARSLLENEQERPNTNWLTAVAIVREAARLLVEFLIDNSH